MTIIIVLSIFFCISLLLITIFLSTAFKMGISLHKTIDIGTRLFLCGSCAAARVGYWIPIRGRIKEVELEVGLEGGFEFDVGTEDDDYYGMTGTMLQTCRAVCLENARRHAWRGSRARWPCQVFGLRRVRTFLMLKNPK